MIAPNTLLQNRYLVLEQIGHGGMGAVYKATDQRFGSTVALKETFFDDPALRKAFEREAHLLNRLRHHALPRVSDHFTEERLGQFLVMELIAGSDLSEMIEKQGGAFPLEGVLGWADQLLDALDYLHTQDPPVVHRDIKPQNLKLTSRNQIVLLDFGLAKGTPAAPSRASVTGSVFGYSRNYAPLEQMQGTGTDPRSDIYSLAATLHHLLTGAPPPDALSRAMATVNGQHDPLRPANELHAQVTPSVAAVLSKAMRQSAAQRYQTAEEMRAALREAARRVEDEKNATFIAPALASAAAQDQATQPMGAQTNARQQADTALADMYATTPAAPDARATGVGGGLEAATLLNPANTSAGVKGPPVNAAAGDARSVVTSVRTPPADAPRRSTRSALAAVSALGVLVLLAVAGALYAYTRRSDAPVSTGQQPATRTSATPAPQPTADAQTTAVGVVPTQPLTPSEAAPAQTKQQQQQATAATAPSKSAKRTEKEPTAKDEPADAPSQQQVAADEPDMPAPDSPEFQGLSPAEREELRRLPRRVRRMILEQKKARMMQQRRMEEQRRRSRQPPPPYPPEE